MANIEFLSASKISRFLACPLLFKYDYIDPHGPKVANIYAIYGTAVHAALEWFFTQKRDFSVPTVEQTIQKWEEAFAKEIAEAQTEIQYDDPKVRMLMVVSAAQSLKYYLTKIAINIRPKLMEHKFEMKLSTISVGIRGVIDLIDEDDVIVDYKTVGLDWKKVYTPHYIKNNIQLRLYSIAFRKEFKRIEQRTEYHLFPRSQAEVVIKDRFNTEADIQYILQLAAKLQKIIEVGLFMPNLHTCEKCHLNNSCPKLPWVEQAGGFINIH